MSRYMQKYVKKYRVIAEYDKSTNDFPRVAEGCHAGEIDPSFEDLFIKCDAGCKILHHSGNQLIYYIPSLGRGHNIVKAIYNDIIGNVELLENDYETIYKQLTDNGLIFDIEDTDSEVLFKFKANNIECLEKYLKPKTLGNTISPFSKKNLPHVKYTAITCEELALYKEITSVISKEDLSVYSKINEDFIALLSTKKYMNKDTNDIKADMKISGLSGKNYFHFIGKWKEYLEFTREYIEKKYRTE